MSDKRIVGIVMPKWGLSMEEGRVNEWLVEQGASVAVGDEILDVETDKIAGNVEAADAGVLRRRIAEPGEVYPVKALLGVLVQGEASDAEIDDFIAAQAVAAAAEEAQESEPAYRYVEVGGLRLRYALRGEGGEPLVLVHGFGGDLDNWLFNIEALAAARSVLALDLPGHGESTKRAPEGPLLAGLAATVAGLMDALELDAAHLVGHSLGGAVAMQLALDAPRRVRSLTLVASAGLGPEIDAAYLRGFVAAGSRRELKAEVVKLFADQSLVTRQLVDDLLRFKRLDGVAEVLAAFTEEFLDGDAQRVLLAERVAAAGLPALVVWGAADAIIPSQHAGNLQGAETLVLEGAGHMVQMEAAAKVNAAIERHLGG